MMTRRLRCSSAGRSDRVRTTPARGRLRLGNFPPNTRGERMAKLEKLKGIGDRQIERLHKTGIRSTDALLKWGSTPDGRSEIGALTKISTRRIADWVHRCDLMRIKGVDDDYARLLRRAGVAGIVDLSTRNPFELSEEVEIAVATRSDTRDPARTSGRSVGLLRLFGVPGCVALCLALATPAAQQHFHKDLQPGADEHRGEDHTGERRLRPPEEELDLGGVEVLQDHGDRH